CGFFACAIARSMAKPGQTPTLTVEQIITSAEQWYAQFNGNDASSNTDGMTKDQEYELLHQIGLHYQAIAEDVGQVKLWLEAGYPVMLAVTEASVHDLDLDGANPYPWNVGTSTHIVLATGVDSNGNVLIRDSANISRNTTDASALRPGPRTYDASRLQFVSATVVVPPWRPRPASATEIPQDDKTIPEGWSDDGTTLTAPNGVSVVKGFRDYIHAHTWDKEDMPLAEETGADPVEIGFSQADGNNAGTRQTFMYSELCWTAERGVYRASIGREFWTLVQQAQQTKPVNEAARANVQAAAQSISETAAKLLADVAQL
ncbi:MAG: hypothetical protein ACRDHW_10765, partial [Ktedonobacteraceae bacterium]